MIGWMTAWLDRSRFASRIALMGVAVGCACIDSPAQAQLLDHQALLDRESFWDNRDWDWYREQIPFFESPDAELNTTYYYRWELLTKHLTYGSANSGYSFTEFIDRPFWSGTYGAISCPAGHQLYEARWLRDPRAARDYARYWLRTPGAEPRRYSTWLADAIWAVHEVHPDVPFVVDLLPELLANDAGWEQSRFVPAVGLYWQNGHDDGMEFNIHSRQSQDILRGAPGFRPTLNAYLWADAHAIRRIAELAGESAVAARYAERADSLKRQLQARLWDPRREFFLHLARDDEQRDGATVKAETLTYATGRYAGSPDGRELIGYVPWQFRMPDADKGYEAAWKYLMDKRYFKAPFGPTTVEQGDPQFYLSPSCCWWSGQSWPYATTQTLKALANLLQHYEQPFVDRDDYHQLLHTFAVSHRKDGRPYLAEALHPETGSFEGHDAYNHSEHYFHSAFCDLVITGLVGLQPRADDQVEIIPLAPQNWDYFALDNLAYHGHDLGIYWDRTGERYGVGKGLHLFVDGQPLASQPELGRLSARLPSCPASLVRPDHQPIQVNFAVNNDSLYFPSAMCSNAAPGTSVSKLIDGNYWYHQHPPNRWVAAESTDTSWVEIDFGIARPIQSLKLYFLDDGRDIVPPDRFDLEWFRTSAKQPIDLPLESVGQSPSGRRAIEVTLAEPAVVDRIRFVFWHRAGQRTGLTEIEAWGPAELPVAAAPPPEGNLAFDRDGDGWPRVSASHTSRFDQVAMANDGRISFAPSPANRWTCYESSTPEDWLEIDLGAAQQIGRVEAYLYDDRGGVQAPRQMLLEYWDRDQWREVNEPRFDPETPQGSVRNTIRFTPVRTEKIRCRFLHAEGSKSGVTEFELWAE
jgi:hypothetical protein